MALNKLWTEEELEYLDHIFHLHHSSYAAKAYQLHAKYKGWTPRTRSAILEKAFRVFGTRNVNYDNHCLYQLAELLKIPKDRLYAAERRGALKSYRHGSFIKISNDALIEFAEKFPKSLADADMDALKYFLGDELAKEVKRHDPGRKFAVVHLPTGMKYPSIQAAADATNYSYHAVRWHLVKAKSPLFCRANKVESRRA